MKSFFDKAIEQVFQAIQPVIVLAAASGHVEKATKTATFCCLAVFGVYVADITVTHTASSKIHHCWRWLHCCFAVVPPSCHLLPRFHSLLALLTLFFTLQQAANETD